jgi:hypothetical protein
MMTITRPDAVNDAEDALEVRLRRADPLRAEVLQHDAGQPGLLDERFGDERLAGAHRAGEQQAHRYARGAAFANVLRDHRELFLDLFDAADDGEIVRRVDELDEPEALAPDDLALALADHAQDLFVRFFAHGGGCAHADQVLDLLRAACPA